MHRRCVKEVTSNPGLKGHLSKVAYWPILVAIPFQSTIFPAALAANPAEYLVLPKSLQSKQLHHLYTWPPQGQTQALQGSLRSQTPEDNPHAEVEIKPQLKPRGSMARKKTQNLPTSCTSCRVNPHSQLGRLYVCGIYKSLLRAATKENALVLIAVDSGGKKTQEQDQIRI